MLPSSASVSKCTVLIIELTDLGSLNEETVVQTDVETKIALLLLL